jgi:hypothetical protein
MTQIIGYVLPVKALGKDYIKGSPVVRKNNPMNDTDMSAFEIYIDGEPFQINKLVLDNYMRDNSYHALPHSVNIDPRIYTVAVNGDKEVKVLHL